MFITHTEIRYKKAQYFVPFLYFLNESTKKGIPFIYLSDNLDNFPCTFCVPLSNLIIF